VPGTQHFPANTPPTKASINRIHILLTTRIDESLYFVNCASFFEASCRTRVVAAARCRNCSANESSGRGGFLCARGAEAIQHPRLKGVLGTRACICQK